MTHTTRRRKGRCDIDDGDGTGEHANAKSGESQDLNVETVAHAAGDDSRDGRAGTKRGTAGTGEPHARATTSCRAAGNGENDKDESGRHQGEGD